MDIPENWIHSPGIFPYPGNGDNTAVIILDFRSRVGDWKSRPRSPERHIIKTRNPTTPRSTTGSNAYYQVLLGLLHPTSLVLSYWYYSSHTFALLFTRKLQYYLLRVVRVLTMVFNTGRLLGRCLWLIKKEREKGLSRGPLLKKSTRYLMVKRTRQLLLRDIKFSMR